MHAENTLVELLRAVDSSHPSLAALKLDRHTTEFFGVGFFNGQGLLRGCLVVPVHGRTGTLLGCVGLLPETASAAVPDRATAGFNPREHLFNLHRSVAALDGVHQRVVVVEGVLDCIRVHQAGHPNVVALMSRGLSDFQEKELVENFDEVVLMLNGDDAGWQTTQECVRRLATQVFVKAWVLPARRGPSELSTSEISSML